MGRVVRGRSWPDRIGVYAILDTGTLEASLLPEAAEKMFWAGVRVFQVRAKGWDAGGLTGLCIRLRQALPEQAFLLVNDRADVALVADLDGVHVGDEDLPPAEARAVVGASRVVGYSTHSLDEVRLAMPEVCDYIGFGPVFATTTKRSERRPHGLEGLEAACRAARLPVVAIGGIRVEDVRAVRVAGAAGAAMISGLLARGDPGEAALRAVEAWHAA